MIFSFYSKYMYLPLQVENLTITLELVSVMKSSMTIQDIAFVLDENTSKKGTFHLVIEHLHVSIKTTGVFSYTVVML